MKRIKGVFVLACALMVSAAVSAQTLDDVHNSFNAAAELINGKKFVEAIPVLEKTVSQGMAVGADAMPVVQQAQGLLPVCYLRKGLIAASAKNYEEAIASLDKAAELGELYGKLSIRTRAISTISKVYMASGADAFNSKDYAKAIEIFTKGYEKNPKDLQLALQLAKSYAESGDMAKASEVYTNIISMGDKHSSFKEPADQAKQEFTTYILVEASKAAEGNKLDEVIASTDKILSFDANNAVAHMLRVQVANNVKDYDKVIAMGEAAAAAQTDDVNKSNAYFLLGAAYQNKDNKAKAIECYKKVLAGDNVATAKQQIAALSK